MILQTHGAGTHENYQIDPNLVVPTPGCFSAHVSRSPRTPIWLNASDRAGFDGCGFTVKARLGSEGFESSASCWADSSLEEPNMEKTLRNTGRMVGRQALTTPIPSSAMVQMPKGTSSP